MSATAMDGFSGSDTAWVLASTAMVLFMTPGLALFYGGMSGGNNVLNTMMMSIISMGIVSLIWCVLGFSLALSGREAFVGDLSYAGLVGLSTQVWPGTGLPALLYAAFFMNFAVIAGAIMSGAVVGRMRFGAYVAFTALWTLVVYVPICHWAWGPGGWMASLGVKDFAGGTVVHEVSATSALVLAVLLGPRRGLHEAEAPHSVPLVVLGAGVLWFGWAGFNSGSALGANSVACLALMNTYLAAAASLCVWVLLEFLEHRRASTVGTVTGAIVGLVVITPAAGFVEPLSAVAMGGIGAMLVFPAFHIHNARVDDSLDAFPCHGVGGFVGTVLTGVFAQEGGLLFGGGFHLLGVQLLAAVVCMAYAAAASGLLYLILSRVMRMRVEETQELVGLDAAVHGEKAYRIDSPSIDLEAQSAEKARARTAVDAAAVVRSEPGDGPAADARTPSVPGSPTRMPSTIGS